MIAGGVVYFIQEGSNGPIKIGTSSVSAKSRLSGNQTGNPRPLRLLATVPGYIATERRLHERFSAARISVHGRPSEWFRPVPELLAFIEGAVHASRTTDAYGRDDFRRDLDVELVKFRESIDRWADVWAQTAENIRAVIAARVSAAEMDAEFEQVIRDCREGRTPEPRSDVSNEEMIAAYDVFLAAARSRDWAPTAPIAEA